MNKLKELFLKLPKIIRYLINSCIVTVLDVVIVWILFSVFHMEIVHANTIGVVAGFLADYLLSAMFVFETARKKGGFSVYFGTFLFGLFLADWLIYIGNTVLFTDFSKQWNFLLSKGISIVLPFFILYFLRKLLYAGIDRYRLSKGAGTK